MKKTDTQNSAQANATTTQAAQPVNNGERITADNVIRIGENIAIKALKTCYTKSGMPYLYRFYCGLVGDITENKNTAQPLTDGYDIVQTACVFLCGYIGKRLDDIADGDGKGTDKDGNPITILRGCFRAVNRYIMGEKQKQYKCAYIDDIDENGNRLYYEIPDGWDIPTATDYKRINEIITALKLSQNEKRFLSYRLKGYNLDDIAHKMGIARGNVNTYRQRIKAKAGKIGLTANA